MPRRRFKSRLSSSASVASFWRSTRYRRSRRSRAWIAPVAAVALIAVCGVGYAAFNHLPAPRAAVAQKPATAPAEVAVARAPRPRPLPGPAPLQARLDAIAHAYGEPVGIAVADIQNGWASSVRGDEFFPQQSVSKTWVAMAVLDAVDRGLISIDSPVTMTLADRSVFNQPLGRSLDANGFVTDIPNLLRHALSFSDNSANDTLIRLIGLDAVRDALVRHGLAGIRIGADERHLQARIAGLVWKQDYSEGRNFEAARAKLPTAEWGEVTNAAGQKKTARIQTANGYSLTVTGALAVTEFLLRETPAGGSYTPSRLMGADLVTTLPGSGPLVIE